METVELGDGLTLEAVVARVQRGETLVLTAGGRRVMEVRPAAAEVSKDDAPKPRRLGFLAGKIHFLPGWDDPITNEQLLGEEPL